MGSWVDTLSDNQNSTVITSNIERVKSLSTCHNVHVFSYPVGEFCFFFLELYFLYESTNLGSDMTVKICRLAQAFAVSLR